MTLIDGPGAPGDPRVPRVALAARDLWAHLRRLHRRFREERLGTIAGSLAFTTLLALVPLITVMLAVFTAFPVFASFQDALEKYFLQALVPDHLAKPVLRAVTQFATKAGRLGVAGLIVLALTAMALMLTIDRALNRIWRTPGPRPLVRRVAFYGLALSLGPLAAGLSLTLTTVALSASRGWLGLSADRLSGLLNGVEVGVVALAVGLLFRVAPNTPVAWRHALWGGLWVSLMLEAGKWVLGTYVRLLPTYSAIYGTLATLPVLMLWTYLAWVIVLVGAVGTALAPQWRWTLSQRPAEAPSQPPAQPPQERSADRPAGADQAAG